MSGRKCSEVSYSSALARRERLVRTVRRNHEQMREIAAAMGALVDASDEKFRAVAGDTISVAAEWQSSAQSARGFGLGETESVLLAASEESERQVQAGRTQLERLRSQLNDYNLALEEAERQRAECESTWATQSADIAEFCRSYQGWFTEETFERLSGQVNSVRGLIGSENYASAKAALDDVSKKTASLRAEGQNVAALGVRRDHVVSSLLTVLAECGYVAGKPTLENPADLRSRVRLSVDTITRGDVTFFVSLDNIESDSCISERFCIADFDALSTRLSEGFGITTKFRPPNFEPPHNRRKGELEEPTGASQAV